MMKLFPFLAFLLLANSAYPQQKEVSLSSLLEEMIDREAITKFPLPYYQSKQASSYNRESISPSLPGWFADSDGEFCIRTEVNNGQKEWVLMEDFGPGAIVKIWAVCFYYGLNNTTGANINFYLDGATQPTFSSNFFELVKGQGFVKAPFADSSARAGNLYLPIPYQKGCKITMDQKAFYNIINYRSYGKGTKVASFSMEEFEKTEVLRKRVASVLTQPTTIRSEEITSSYLLEGDQKKVLELPKGPHAVRRLIIHLDSTKHITQNLRSLVLQADFDGRTTVWVPLGDFFNNVGKVEPFDMWERSVTPDGTFVCRWWMPYQNKAQISLVNLGEQAIKFEIGVSTEDYEWNDQSMHFYATWQMEKPTPTFPLFDWNFLSAEGQGVIVGDQWTVLNPVEGWWGEGDEKIYIDNDFNQNFPSHFGTGTEDYYGWAGGIVPTPNDQFAKPFLGNIIVADPRSKGYNVCTRTRSLDAIPFKERIRFDIESSCGKRSKSHFLQYSQTTFWYGKPNVTHNKPPLPQFAALALPQIADLEEKIQEATGSVFEIPNAIEAEVLASIKTSKEVKQDFQSIAVWGEKSGGDMKEYWFAKEREWVEVKLSEQFQEAHLQVCAAVGTQCGDFEIWVNDQQKTSQDLFSKHAGMTTPFIDLGVCQPKDNAFIIRFIYLGGNEKSGKYKEHQALGLDCFLVKH